MKLYIPLLLSIPLMASCSMVSPLSQDSMIVRIVDIETTAPNGSSGHGVILRSGEVLTSLHIVRTCLRSQVSSWAVTYKSAWCSIIENGRKNIIQSITVPNNDQDVAYLSYSWTQDMNSITLISLQDITIWQPISALLNRSGAWQRIDGHILELNVAYRAYDGDLEGKIFTGALVTNILLELGESGTPIWTHSWELIGVVSAVDRGGKRSYIVRYSE